MADLVVQNIARTGLIDAPVAADVAGDDFPNEGNSFLEVINGGAGSINVTISSNYSTPPTGTAQSDVVVAVGAGVTTLIGPFPQSGYNDASGKCNVTYSDVTTVTVSAISMGSVIAK